MFRCCSQLLELRYFLAIFLQPTLQIYIMFHDLHWVHAVFQLCILVIPLRFLGKLQPLFMRFCEPWFASCSFTRTLTEVCEESYLFLILFFLLFFLLFVIRICGMNIPLCFLNILEEVEMAL
uniref:Uncharacterized protein n=1 Tax=Ixodes ricinus TaxID=34613 RepID=A0A6B0UPE4_IXORI